MGTSHRQSTIWTTKTIQLLTQDELRRLLNILERTRDYAIFLFAYCHGLRTSEVGLLYVQDLDFTQQRIRTHRLKHSIAGVHPRQLDEARAIKAHLWQRPYESPTLLTSQRCDPISRRQLDNLMWDYGKLASIPESKRHFHVLKHSTVTHLLDAGADLRFVQEWIGHVSIKHTVLCAQLINRRRNEETRQEVHEATRSAKDREGFGT